MKDHEYDGRYTEYQLKRSALRKFARRIYLKKARSNLHGPTLDLGCGVGELLEGLPEGSKGLEYNKATVAYCKSRGLNVDWYDGFADGWALSPALESDGLRSMVISHVLEHLHDPMLVLGNILAACPGKGIRNVLIIVPGQAGYRSDPTHLTFVDFPMIEQKISHLADWEIANTFHFPLDVRALGDRFTHHELHVLLRKK